MSELKTNMQHTFRQLKSKMSYLIEQKSENTVHVTVRLDEEVYAWIEDRAAQDQTDEQTVLLKAVHHYVKSRSGPGLAHISEQQKENNPLFLLNGFTKKIT